jgi:hypothetical protein
MVLRANGRPPFERKSRDLDSDGEPRHAYIAALRAADGHDCGPLLELLLRDRP